MIVIRKPTKDGGNISITPHAAAKVLREGVRVVVSNSADPSKVPVVIYHTEEGETWAAEQRDDDHEPGERLGNWPTWLLTPEEVILRAQKAVA